MLSRALQPTLLGVNGATVQGRLLQPRRLLLRHLHRLRFLQPTLLGTRSAQEPTPSSSPQSTRAPLSQWPEKPARQRHQAAAGDRSTAPGRRATRASASAAARPPPTASRDLPRHARLHCEAALRATIGRRPRNAEAAPRAAHGAPATDRAATVTAKLTEAAATETKITAVKIAIRDEKNVSKGTLSATKSANVEKTNADAETASASKNVA